MATEDGAAPRVGGGFTTCYIARLRQDRPREEMRAYWTDRHGELGRGIPGLRSYVQNHVVGSIGADGLSDEPVRFDGYSVHRYDDRRAFEEAMASPVWADVVADGANVFSMESMDGFSAVLEERVIRDGPPSPFKVVWVARFRPDIDVEDAAEHWLRVHAPIALKIGAIDRYVQSLAVRSIGMDGVSDERPAFDGFSECWFADAQTFLASVRAGEWKELEADGVNFLQMQELDGMSAILDERVIL